MKRKIRVKNREKRTKITGEEFFKPKQEYTVDVETKKTRI